MFKTELHCHSKSISQCARVASEEIINSFTAKGYTTLVLANHFNRYTMNSLGITDWNDWIDRFLAGYEELRRDAEGKLIVLLGMELRFDRNINDYLVFGITKDFLKKYPNMFEMDPRSFHEIAKENGCLFIQAHPFRNNMTVVHPHELDGVEVFNGHMGHDSRNDIAEAWADKFGLIKTSGTDFHYADSPANGGIFTEKEITTMEELIETLKSGNYTLNKEY